MPSTESVLSNYELAPMSEKREVECLKIIGTDRFDIHLNDSGDDGPIDPLSEDALECELKKSGAYALSKVLIPLRREQNKVPREEDTEIVNAGINWAHRNHTDRKGIFKTPGRSRVISLSDITVGEMNNALRRVNQAAIFHKAWEYLEVRLAARMARATKAHIDALRSVVSQRDETIGHLRDALNDRDGTELRLKRKLVREREILAKLQEKQEKHLKEQHSPIPMLCMFLVIILLELCLLCLKSPSWKMLNSPPT